MKGYLKANLDKHGKTISFRIGAPMGKDPLTDKHRYHFETVKTDSITVARKRLRALMTEIDKGTFIEPGKQTTKEYLETWLRDTALPNMRPWTYTGYEYKIKKYIIPAIGHIALTSLKPPHIQKLCADIQNAGHDRTAQYVYVTLSKSLGAAVKMGLLAQNPCEGVESPKVSRHEMQVMNENSLNTFLEKAKDGPYYGLFYTYLFTGMRRSELLALQWKDVDLLLCQISLNRTVNVIPCGTYKGQTVYKQPKTAKSRRLIALTPSNALVLKEHREAQEKTRLALGLPATTDEDFVFCHWDGKPFKPDSITHAWKRLARERGLEEIRLNDSRHSHATLMLKQGIHPKIVQERLGHASISTTLDIYSHVVPGLQAAAAAKFDDILQPKEKKLDQELTAIIQK